MQSLIDRITDRIISAGIGAEGGIMFFTIEKGMYGEHNRCDADLFSRVLFNLKREVLLICTPLEPYRTIIGYLSEASGEVVCPGDYETRLLLTDLPVVKEFTENSVTSALVKRRGAVIRGGDIVIASKNLMMAYVTLSSICFACYVKFFSDYLRCSIDGKVDGNFDKSFRYSCGALDPLPEFDNTLMKGPFASKEDVLAAMVEAGRLTVASRLVDSSFGNISFLMGNTLYISSSGSFLDELRGHIVAVDLGSQREVPSTVSSEFPVHRGVVMTTGRRAVLHGHPKFSVILSMVCPVKDCEFSGSCQMKCPGGRSVDGIPVVSGISGTGQYGLCHTLPPAMKSSSAVIVYGHGLFASGAGDFNEAFAALLSAEKNCRSEYFRLLQG